MLSRLCSRNFFRCSCRSLALRLALSLGGTRSNSLGNCRTVISFLLTESLFQCALLLVLKGWHFTQQVFYSLWAEGFSHCCIFRGTLLNFYIHRILTTGKHRCHKRSAFLVEIRKLGIGTNENGPSLCIGCCPMLMQNSELLFSTHTWPFRHQKSEFSKHIGCHTNSCLVATTRACSYQQCSCRVGLQVALGVVRDNLNDTMPDGITHVITTDGNQLQDRVNVPTKIGGILLSQNCDFQHHFFPNGGICHC
mmetsp:Transcript_18499/g.45812  ORF Transcript_18499/g.45812 Transcript_18499/m.45812 type:complete len:251 (+) Transcript_18499:1068-1820(+)